VGRRSPPQALPRTTTGGAVWACGGGGDSRLERGFDGERETVGVEAMSHHRLYAWVEDGPWAVGLWI
jgi:hypothetical protein